MTAVEGIREAHPAAALVLVGHGTAWTLVAAALTGAAPDLARWQALALPDVIEVDAAPA